MLVVEVAPAPALLLQRLCCRQRRLLLHPARRCLCLCRYQAPCWHTRLRKQQTINTNNNTQHVNKHPWHLRPDGLPRRLALVNKQRLHVDSMRTIAPSPTTATQHRSSSTISPAPGSSGVLSFSTRMPPSAAPRLTGAHREPADQRYPCMQCTSVRKLSCAHCKQPEAVQPRGPKTLCETSTHCAFCLRVCCALPATAAPCAHVLQHLCFEKLTGKAPCSHLAGS